MWSDLIQDNSLISYCNIHNKCDESEIFELFSLETKKESTSNYEHYISDNVNINGTLLFEKLLYTN